MVPFSASIIGFAKKILLANPDWLPYRAAKLSFAVAKTIHQLGWSAEHPYEYSRRTVRVHRSGDILHITQVPGLAKSLPLEVVDCQQVLDPLLEAGESVAIDPRARRKQLLPGSAGFPSHLAHVLKTPVDYIISDGGAATDVRQRLSVYSEIMDNKKVYHLGIYGTRFFTWRRRAAKCAAAPRSFAPISCQTAG